MNPAPPLNKLRIVSFRPSVNFVNTVDPREGEDPVDYTPTYSALALWAMRARVVTRMEGERLIRTAHASKRQAQAAFGRAITLREPLYRVFSALAAHRRPADSELYIIQHAFHEAIEHAQLYQHGQQFHWQVRHDLELISSRIALDVVDLLESGLANRLKRCPGSGDCGWIFMDTSKNGTRRWCSMAGCGNRVKARRHSRKVR